MCRYQLSHLGDGSLLSGLKKLVAQDCATTAELLAHLAEVDDRKLYLQAAYPSMYAYCVEELHLCEQAAYKRILAARTARRFPAIFGAVAQGRLHLSAVCLLAPHLTEGTANELLTAATHRTKAEIERLLAERFPRPDMLAWVQLMSRPCPTSSVEPSVHVNGQLSPGIVDAPPAAAESGDRSRVKPLTPQRFQVQFTMSGEAHDLLRYAQALLGHQVPSGDIGQIFERAMKLLVPHLERTKFAAAQKPRRGQLRSSANPRHVPAHVKRTVWERDGGQCTFVSDGGRRCPARSRLEFDHVQEVARGGEATVAGMRLRCRAHNQYTAERTFGTEFMIRKRKEEPPRRDREIRHEAARALAPARVAPARPSEESDVTRCLRHLGFRADEVRRAVAASEAHPDASLEGQVRFALSYLRPPHRQVATGSPRLPTDPRGTPPQDRRGVLIDA